MNLWEGLTQKGLLPDSDAPSVVRSFSPLFQVHLFFRKSDKPPFYPNAVFKETRSGF